LHTAGDEARISRDANSKKINVEGKPCGSADIVNTDFILVADYSAGNTTVRIVSTAGGGFQEGSDATARRLGLRTGAASRTLGRLQPLALTAGSPRSTRVRLRRAWRHALLRARSTRLALSARATDQAGRTSAPVRTTVTVRGRPVR
jgi:hypothetical protein